MIGDKAAGNLSKQESSGLMRLKGELRSTRGQRPRTRQKTVILNIMISVPRQLGKRPGGRIVESRQVVWDRLLKQRPRATPENRRAVRNRPRDESNDVEDLGSTSS
jgi:hypothetical protein